MLYHMMKAIGCKVALAGNIGRPLIDIMDESYDYIVAEFSSYQASDLSASPQVALFFESVLGTHRLAWRT